ncbi:MAG: electron transfer flavoprotein subunit beta/FixA family protein [Halodesulfurarchaeum sp.]
MKVLVTVTEVADVAEDFEIHENRIEEEYLEYELNEWDDYAVETAIRLAENGIADEVVVATIGPERVEETIRLPLAKGADRAIRVWDDGLAGRDVLDVETRASVLSSIVEQESPELVFAGVQAADDGFGSTGVALAREAGYQWAAVVNDFELEEGDESARVHRELEGGFEEVTTVQLPAVFTIQTGINDPRYASLRGIRQAQSKDIDHLTRADLGIEPDAEQRIDLATMEKPESSDEATYFEGDPGEQAVELASLLSDSGVVGE